MDIYGCVSVPTFLNCTSANVSDDMVSAACAAVYNCMTTKLSKSYTYQTTNQADKSFKEEILARQLYVYKEAMIRCPASRCYYYNLLQALVGF